MLRSPWVGKEVVGGKRNSAGMELLPFTRAIFGRPALGRTEVKHLRSSQFWCQIDSIRKSIYLCGNNVELELLPVVIGLFER